jgi:translation initiation factor IF-3
MQLNDALNLAYDKNLDLVLVSSNNPKVCKIMNYGKYKFEQSKKEKEARKKQKSFEMKEIRVTPNTDTHDFEFKAKNARKFLEDGNKLKITVRFRGREMNYKSQGEELLNKFIEALEDIANTEKRPIMEGKNMFIILTKKS